MTVRRLSRADGHTLAYQQHSGSGPGVVFLCGFRSDMTGIKARTLEDHCRAQGRAFVRFDYLGHGVSSGQFTDGTLSRWLDDTLAVLDELTTGPQVLVGSSMGGWLMLLAALARPERVAGLLGIATATDFVDDLLWARLPESVRSQLQREGVVYLPSVYSSEPTPLTWHFIEDGRRHRLLTAPIALTCPVRLLHGMQDRDVPWQTSLRLSECLSGADVRLTLLKDGDHRLSRPADLALLTATLDDLIIARNR